MKCIEILPNVMNMKAAIQYISGNINLNHTKYTHLSATK